MSRITPTMENRRRIADSDRIGVAEAVSALVILAVAATLLAVPKIALIAVAAGAVGYGIASLRQSHVRAVRANESGRLAVD